jgi:SAM-dependent methyltransferase
MLSTVQMPVAIGDTWPAGLIPRCPRCGGSLDPEVITPAMVCRTCLFRFCEHEGIWLALPAERQKNYAQFVSDYERIRAAEGRGSDTSDYYLALPYRDLSGRNQSQWTIRARTFRYLVERILPQIKTTAAANPHILDVGAGNGWLSYRLALMGARPVAVDLLVNDHDGLGAAKHFRNHLQTMFPCIQAESTHLPFASSQFDAVIFNASFHYAENYANTVSEAVRCLKPGGMIIVADSPWYRRESSGEQMLVERRAAFLSRFSTLSNSIPSQEFLTDDRLHDLEREFGFRWELHRPYYGVRWSMRPWLARLRGRREPARFQIYTARTNA